MSVSEVGSWKVWTARKLPDRRTANMPGWSWWSVHCQHQAVVDCGGSDTPFLSQLLDQLARIGSGVADPDAGGWEPVCRHDTPDGLEDGEPSEWWNQHMGDCDQWLPGWDVIVPATSPEEATRTVVDALTPPDRRPIEALPRQLTLGGTS